MNAMKRDSGEGCVQIFKFQFANPRFWGQALKSELFYSALVDFNAHCQIAQG